MWVTYYKRFNIDTSGFRGLIAGLVKGDTVRRELVPNIYVLERYALTAFCQIRESGGHGNTTYPVLIVRSLEKAPYIGIPSRMESSLSGLQVIIAQTSFSSVTPAANVISSGSISLTGLKWAFMCFAIAVRRRTVPV